ncbi:MAG: metallophosphoesterase [Kiritimatiellae bacterium]|nr:metallophosphoesterase [Kiritimatiellia bacterium]
MKESMTRKDFLKSTLALGGLIATSRLPALADNPAIFPKRGRFERLSINKVHINAGATEPFSVLHISDTHLTEAYPQEDEKKQKLKEVRTQTFGGRQEEALRDSIAWAKDNTDYLLHTGDLIDWISQANLDLVKKYYGDAMFGSIGNHEYSHNMWLDKGPDNPSANLAKTRELLSQYYPFNVSFASQVVNGVRFISLDEVHARVTPEQVEQFKAEAKKGQPIVLITHVPFYTDFIFGTNAKYWNYGTKFRGWPDTKGEYKIQKEDPVTRDFIAYLKSEPLLKGILAGHLHITVQDRFSPTAMEYVVGGNYGFVGQEVSFT